MHFNNFFRKAASVLLCTALVSSLCIAPVSLQEVQASADPYGLPATDDFGADAYGYLEELFHSFPARTNQEFARSESLNQSGLWIKSQLESFGYQVMEHAYPHYNFTGINYAVTKPGLSDKVIVIGAHYDSMPTFGIDDNGSGVSVVLELAKRFYSMETPCTLQFVFFDNEEYGHYAGSCCYVHTYLEPNNLLENILCCINIDSIAGGDRLYGYGGEYTEEDTLIREWVYEEANLIADEMDIPLYTLPEQVEMFRSPTRISGSDQYYFAVKGIPYLYLESSLWCNEDGTGGNEETRLTCHYQTANEAFASTGGQIMHTEFDNLDTLNQLLPGRVQRNLHDASQLVTYLLLDISPDTEASIPARKAAAQEAASLLSAEASEAESTEETPGQTEESPEKVSSDASTDETESASFFSESGESESTAAAPVIDSNHHFMTGIFITIGTLLILFIIFLLCRSITANRRRRKRIKRYGEYGSKR